MQPYPDISASILAFANERGPDKTTCPSEIARALFPNHWREHMKEVVDVAISLQNLGKVVITQKGSAIDITRIKGPIRIKIR